MATFTPNLNLEQQGGGERASLVVLNANLGKIDEFAGKAQGTVITNEYSTVLSAINALRTSKTFPFTIQKAGSSSFSDLPSGVSSTCEWTVVCSGSSERVTAILTIYTGGSSMNGWSWTANIYNGSYIRDWFSVNEQLSYASISIDTSNKTTFTFSDLHNLNNSSIFKHGLLVWGVSSNSQSAGISFVFVDTNGNVTVFNLTGNTDRTFTGSLSGTTLTITASQTVYGGLKLIWLT